MRPLAATDVADCPVRSPGGVVVARFYRFRVRIGGGAAAESGIAAGQVVPFVVALQVIVGVAGLRAASKLCDWRAVRRLAPGLVVGIPIGLTILSRLPPNPVRLTIGLTIAASVAILWKGLRLPPNPSPAIAVAVGFTSGIISGLASMGGPIVVVYLMALGHGAAVVRATSVVYFMLSSLTALIPMSFAGMIDQEVLLWSVAAIPALFAGSWVGSWGFRLAKPHHHRATALIVLSVLAATLIARSLLVL